MKTQEEIEQLAKNRNETDPTRILAFIKGYTQCQEDVDWELLVKLSKRYTEEDLRKAFKYGVDMEAGIESFDYKNYPDGFSQFINSLNKQD